MKDPQTSCSEIILDLEADQRICLTGTPFQNNFQYLYSLIKLICLETWKNKLFWKKCIEEPVSACDQQAISTLQQIMRTINLRRLKTTMLNLPNKHQKWIETPWDEFYWRKHTDFEIQFGKNHIMGNRWDSGKFFQNMVDLRQFCNHPELGEKKSGKGLYGWDVSSKIVHLLKDLKNFLKIPHEVKVQ